MNPTLAVAQLADAFIKMGLQLNSMQVAALAGMTPDWDAFDALVAHAKACEVATIPSDPNQPGPEAIVPPVRPEPQTLG
jgi:hypothetical protein